MMKETDFLIRILNEWCRKFDGIHVRYAYDANTEYHIVEVDPESIRRGNERYEEAELALWTSFMEAFPESDLLVCEPTGANQMSNCLFDSRCGQINKPEIVSIWMDLFTVSNKVTLLSKKSTYANSLAA